MASGAHAETSQGGGSVSVEDMKFPHRLNDRYELLKLLATGGMAELFLAKQTALEGFEKVVVVKRILEHLAEDEEFVKMFLDEARIAAKLSHPNIVQIYDLGKSNDSHYIVMEYVSGRNVQHLIQKLDETGETMPIEHSLRIVAGVCDGLYYAHSRKDYDGQPLNIVHRDISPQNILVSFGGGVKLVDFGIAKASTQLAQTRAGVLKGKYAYMSPEQVRGSAIDHRSDIFSVGLVMYEMLTGQRAFERDTSLKTLKAIVQEKPLNPKELRPDLPDGVIKLLSRALEKKPERRYPDAQSFQLAIEDYLEQSPKKSNAVRLSRYMYDVFDDELNAEGGTMVVQGIGEVIIPTGHEGKDLKPRVQEEVDHQTLSAVLAPGTNAADIDAAYRAQKEKAEQRLKSKSDEALSAEAETRTAAPSPAPTVDSDIEEESGEDKTIPVYDLEEYERNRELRKGASEESEAETMGGMSPSSKAPSMRLGSDEGGHTDEIGASLIEQARQSVAEEDLEEFSDGEATATVDPETAQALLAKSSVVDAPAATLPVSRPDEGVASTALAGDDEEEEDGEDRTSQLPPDWQEKILGTDPSKLHSSEAVVGPGGVVQTSGETAIRPAGVRPAATPGASLARPVRDVAPPVRPAADATPVTRDGPAIAAVAAGTVAESGATATAPGPPAKKGSLPTWVFLAMGGVALMMVVALIVGGVAIYIILDRSAPAVATDVVQVDIVPTPEDAQVAVDGGEAFAGPLTVFLTPGEHTMAVSAAGYAPLEETFEVKSGEPDTIKPALTKAK